MLNLYKYIIKFVNKIRDSVTVRLLRLGFSFDSMVLDSKLALNVVTCVVR